MAGPGLWGSKGFTGATSAQSFLKSVLQSGVGRHVVQLKRATLKFCEASDYSRHMRHFVQQDLVDFARRHPTVVVYVVPERDADPMVSVEFLNGREEVHSMRLFERDEILHKMEVFATRSGLEIVKIRKPFHTDCPSIQGQWHPFTNAKYDITKELEYKLRPVDAWTPVSSSMTKYYRKHEVEKLTNRPKLTVEEKSELPLGKWGPILAPEY